MHLPNISDIEVSQKKVLLRADLDVDSPDDKDQRLVSAAQTVKALLEKQAKIIILGHRGRPEGKINNEFSLKPICEVLSKVIGQEMKFVYDLAGAEAAEESAKLESGQVMMLENLRFDAREEVNDESFAKSLADLGDVYVNEAFASSHREHASIVALPRICKSLGKGVAMGQRFEKEIENLSKVTSNPKRPLVFIISGIKEDKLAHIKAFEEFADKILVGGRLPEFFGDEKLVSVRVRGEDEKVIIGNLIMDKEDITLNTIDRFEKEIAKAGTIVVSGPVGRFEDAGHRQGTERVFKAVVANKEAFKVAGGGDTEEAVKNLGLSLSDFSWVSVGGGAMLEFLSNKTLPGIEILR